MAESLRFAVLGLIVTGPTYGYRVAEELRRWPLPAALAPTQRSIYHALDRLISAGAVSRRAATSAEVAGFGAALASVERSAPQPRVVVVTPDGVSRFEAWMRQPLQDEAELFWRIGAARAEDVPVLRGVLREAEQNALAMQRGQPVVNLRPLRDGSWPASKLALLSVASAARIGAHAALLREMSAVLDSVGCGPENGG